MVLNEIVNKPQDFGEQKSFDYLELKNGCDERIDMAGWKFNDEKGNEFVMGQDGCEHIIGEFGYFVFFRESQCSFDFGFTSSDNVSASGRFTHTPLSVTKSAILANDSIGYVV